MKIVVTTGIYTPRTPPAIFCGDSDLGKIFLRFFWGIEPTTPTPHTGPTTLPRHFGLPSLALHCYINQNPEVACFPLEEAVGNLNYNNMKDQSQSPIDPIGHWLLVGLTFCAVVQKNSLFDLASFEC
jgi:hypothetical protein